MMDKVKVAVVGCGSIAQGMHLPGIQGLVQAGLAELTAVCDVVPDLARTVGERFGARTHYTEMERMLAEADCDLVVNCTRIPEHFAVNLTALQAGKHVYTQKPMTTTVSEATTLVQEAQRRGLLLGCAPEHPARPVIRKVRELVDGGAIGKVAFARMSSSHDGPERHDVPRDSTWYYRPGSNPILDLGVHGLSMITSILGPVRRLACFSGRNLPTRLTTAGPYKGKRIDVQIDDNSLLMLDFGDAVLGYLDATYCVLASAAPFCEIYGSAGTLSLSRQGGEIVIRHFREGEDWREVPVEAPPPTKDLGVWHMVGCLREGQPLLLTGELGRHLVEVMTQAPVAAAEGRAIAMETAF